MIFYIDFNGVSSIQSAHQKNFLLVYLTKLELAEKIGVDFTYVSNKFDGKLGGKVINNVRWGKEVSIMSKGSNGHFKGTGGGSGGTPPLFNNGHVTEAGLRAHREEFMGKSVEQISLKRNE